jgi:hypothetical protein
MKNSEYPDSGGNVLCCCKRGVVKNCTDGSVVENNVNGICIYTNIITSSKLEKIIGCCYRPLFASLTATYNYWSMLDLYPLTWIQRLGLCNDNVIRLILPSNHGMRGRKVDAFETWMVHAANCQRLFYGSVYSILGNFSCFVVFKCFRLIRPSEHYEYGR